MTQIKDKFSNVIASGDDSLKSLATKHKANLYGASLSRANLSGANLSGASLSRADLYGANLSRADLYGADLSGADLSGANLSGANLYGADLSRADLSGADLSGADLSGANLYGASLSRANLSGAKIEFWQFPSIRLLSSMQLGKVSDELTTELFRRDMAAHPNPELFKAWAKENGSCPYINEERWWFFELRKECWEPGKPRLTDCELIKAICVEKGWKIKGYQL